MANVYASSNPNDIPSGCIFLGGVPAQSLLPSEQDLWTLMKLRGMAVMYEREKLKEEPSEYVLESLLEKISQGLLELVIPPKVPQITEGLVDEEVLLEKIKTFTT